MNFKADVYLQDQAPRIGCGWRRVDVKLGRRWIRLTEIATGKRARLPKTSMVGYRAIETLAAIGAKIVA